MDATINSMGPPAQPRKLSLEDCLNTVVEGYLLPDLASMTDDIEWKERGAVCYPMLMAVLAGSELLGRLAGGKGNGEVEHYWNEFMSRINPL
jgi:hypothetical protein